MSRAAEVAVSEPIDDAGLIARFRGGDRRAFDELVARHEKLVFRLALRSLRDVGDAEDVTQRAFVQAFQRLDAFRGDSTFRTWLYRIAFNLVVTHARDAGRQRRALQAIAPEDLLPHAHAAGGAEPARGGEESARLRSAVEKLPVKQRLVVELRIYDELPFREVAQIADCSEDSAKMNFHHALKRLRELLQEGADA
ncbi:MAG TPA: sigma-70 family RNA polymerase sigma factor [Polyangia bacterium]|nr:sigma-70 family RNA polymerase sigma factor [Polyangia bacterium]